MQKKMGLKRLTFYIQMFGQHENIKTPIMTHFKNISNKRQ